MIIEYCLLSLIKVSNLVGKIGELFFQLKVVIIIHDGEMSAAKFDSLTPHALHRVLYKHKLCEIMCVCVCVCVCVCAHLYIAPTMFGKPPDLYTQRKRHYSTELKQAMVSSCPSHLNVYRSTLLARLNNITYKDNN